MYVGTVEGGNETPLNITYDPKYVGSPLTIGSKQLTWEGRKLKQIVDGNNTFTHTYNELGLRIKENINGVKKIIIYNEQNQLVGFEYQQSKYFYVRDLL